MLRLTVSGRFCQRDLFAREDPASLEGPPEAWDLAITVIDHGCCIFEKLGSRRPELGLRDPVVIALFRRILITGEAVRSLLVQGLEEPAIATSRTLLELERNLRLVLADPSDERARRLALFLAVKGRRHFAKAPKNPRTRRLLQRDKAFFGWFKGRSRSFRELLESDDFHEVAEELRQADHWHGFNSQQEAFEEAEMASDYHLGFEGTSLFVHAANVEHDFWDADDKRIRLKPFAQRDPAHTLAQLGRLTLSLIEIFRLIWEDRGRPEYQERVRFEDEHGHTGAIHALNALSGFATRVFPDPVPPSP